MTLENIDETPSQIEKPKVLYHASANRDITTFVPRADSYRDRDEGPVIFATPDPVYASMFIVPSDDSWTSKGRYAGGPWTCVIGDINKYKSLDRGGSIYEIDPETFESDPNKNLHKTEWVSKVPVQPTRNVQYESGLKAMIELGVRVIILEPDEFAEFQELKTQGRYEDAYNYLDSHIPETIESIKGVREEDK